MSDILQLEAYKKEHHRDQDALFENALDQSDMTMEQKQELLTARRGETLPRGTWIYCALDCDPNEKIVVRVHFFEEYPDGLVEYELFSFSKNRRFGEGKEAYFLYAFRYVDSKKIVYEGGFQEFLSGLSMSLTWKFLNVLDDDDGENPYFIPWLYYYWREGGSLRERLFASRKTGCLALYLNRFKGLRYDQHEFEEIFELPEACLTAIDEFYVESLLDRDVRIKVTKLYERYKHLLSTDSQRKESGIELIIDAVCDGYPEEEIESCLTFIRDKMCEEDNFFEYSYYLSCRRRLPSFKRITVLPNDVTDDAAESISRAFHCLVESRDYYSARFRMYQGAYYEFEFENDSYQVKIPDSLEDLWNAGLSLNLSVHNSFKAICRGALFIFFLLSKKPGAIDPVGLFAVRRNAIVWSAGKDNHPLSDHEKLFLSEYAAAHGLEVCDERYMVNDLLTDRRWSAGDDGSE